MLNKPRFQLFRHIKFALEGLKDILLHESSFRIQAIFFFLISVTLLFIEISILSKILLFASMFFVLISEAVNSAIERIVDLVTIEDHPLAKRAKDVGAAIVLLSFIMTLAFWIAILLKEFQLL